MNSEIQTNNVDQKPPVYLTRQQKRQILRMKPETLDLIENYRYSIKANIVKEE